MLIRSNGPARALRLLRWQGPGSSQAFSNLNLGEIIAQKKMTYIFRLSIKLRFDGK